MKVKNLCDVDIDIDTIPDLWHIAMRLLDEGKET